MIAWRNFEESKILNSVLDPIRAFRAPYYVTQPTSLLSVLPSPCSSLCPPFRKGKKKKTLLSSYRVFQLSPAPVPKLSKATPFVYSKVMSMSYVYSFTSYEYLLK